MPTITVKDANGVDQVIEMPSAPGSAPDAASKPSTMSTEDKAVAAATKTAVETVAGAVDATKMKSKVADGDDATVGAKADAPAPDDTGAYTLIALMKRCLGYLANLVSGVSFFSVRTGMTVVSKEITRPNNTTNYDPNDVWGPDPAAVITFDNIMRENGASGYATKVTLECDQTPDYLFYRLYFFKNAPAAIADGSPFTLLYTNADDRLGYVDITNMGIEGSGGTSAFGQWTGQHALKADAGSRNIYGVLVIKTAQVAPPALKKMRVIVSMDNN